MIAFKVNINERVLRDAFGRLRKRLPLAVNEDAEEIANIYAKNLQRNAETWRSSTPLLKSIKVVKMKGNQWVIEMNRYGFYRAFDPSPGWYAPSGFGDVKNDIMKKWIIDKDVRMFGGKPYTAPAIFVKPKDWITPALRNGASEVDIYMRGGRTALDKLLG